MLRFSHRLYSTAPSYKHILTSQQGRVGIVQLNRPKALNALCNDLMTEVNDALKKFDKSDDVGAIVLTGSDKAFAGKPQYIYMFN